jgi:gentisate 1,2-dioxygenase
MSGVMPNLEELDRRLAEKWISGIWRIPAGARPGDPKTKIQPHLWKWADIYDGLVQARDQITRPDGRTARSARQSRRPKGG